MRTSENLDQLATALAKAQAAFEVAGKDKSAKITSAKGNYSYSYADLPTIVAACRPALAAAGLSVIQAVSARGADVTVTTRLLHASGQWVSDEDAPLTMTARDNSPQAIGSACTYARRYGLMTLLGVVAGDEDDDAQSAQPRPYSNPTPQDDPRDELPLPADSWTSVRLQALLERLIPGKGREVDEARLDKLSELMDLPRAALTRGETLYSRFANGKKHLREGLIQLVERLVAEEEKKQ